ncbi:hypothetical protein HN51_011213 [Arachis hypogaea]
MIVAVSRLAQTQNQSSPFRKPYARRVLTLKQPTRFRPSLNSLFLAKQFWNCPPEIMANGNMEVNWANGFTTKVAPYEVFRIEKHEGSSVISIPHETNVDKLPRDD